MPQVECLLREALGARGVKLKAPEPRKRGRPPRRNEMSDDGPEWFAPKRYGFGAGLPIAWQGWAVTIGFIAISTALALLFAIRPLLFIAAVDPDHRHLAGHRAPRPPAAAGAGVGARTTELADRQVALLVDQPPFVEVAPAWSAPLAR